VINKNTLQISNGLNILELKPYVIFDHIKITKKIPALKRLGGKGISFPDRNLSHELFFTDVG